MDFRKARIFQCRLRLQRKRQHGQPLDPERIMVRARLRSHLVALKERFGDFLGDCEIQESTGTDYAYRLFLQKSVWMRVVAGLAEETDYDNFKSEVAHHQGKPGAAYEHSLHDVGR